MKRESFDQKQKRMNQVLSVLKRLYPESQCSLKYETPFQLLVATILSAQCTDERVNQVTPRLFRHFPDARAMALAPVEQVETLIQSTGFYRNKAKSIVETSKILVEKYAGQVPRELDQLVALRGVGRKTANVILGNAYGVPGLVVDTHVGRLSRRMGFTRHMDPVKVEREMMEIVPQKNWTIFSHWLIDHGRAVCSARKPACDQCELNHYCMKVGV